MSSESSNSSASPAHPYLFAIVTREGPLYRARVELPSGEVLVRSGTRDGAVMNELNTAIAERLGLPEERIGLTMWGHQSDDGLPHYAAAAVFDGTGWTVAFPAQEDLDQPVPVPGPHPTGEAAEQAALRAVAELTGRPAEEIDLEVFSLVHRDLAEAYDAYAEAQGLDRQV